MIQKLRELLNFLNDFNTTSGRIVATIVLAFITGVRVLFLSKWLGQIDIEILIAWCTFLGALGSLDVVQFVQKRKSFQPTVMGSNILTDSGQVVNRRVLGEDEGIEVTP